MDNMKLITEVEEAPMTWQERREHFVQALKQNRFSCPYDSFLILTGDDYSFVDDMCYIPDTTLVIGWWDEETRNELEL